MWQGGRITTTGGVALLLVLFGGFVATASGAEPELRGQWRFDELDGQSALDDGPYGLDGRLGATAAPDPADPARVPGASGEALRFADGSFVRLPAAPELAVETLTVEAVVRAGSSPGRFRYVVSRGSHGCVAGSYGLYTGTAGGIAIYVFDGSRYAVSAIARPSDVWDGAWHHVAGTFDGRALRLYVDGHPVGDPLEAPIRIDYATTTTDAAFGRYVGACDLSFRGELDLVRLWSASLSAEAVADAVPLALHPEDPGAPRSILPSPLPAATPAAILPAGPQNGAPPAAAPGAPARACALQLSRTRVAARRRTPVRVRVTLRGQPVRSVRVVAKRRGRAKPISAARTGVGGRVRLVIHVRKPGRVRVSAAMRPTCAPTYIRVARPR
jgi:concanavalin A-like lectin/glucanase superfamily protein